MDERLRRQWAAAEARAMASFREQPSAQSLDNNGLAEWFAIIVYSNG